MSHVTHVSGLDNGTGGGESVSQSALKDNAFLTFVDQKPLFELPLESEFSSSTKANSPSSTKVASATSGPDR